MNNYHFTSESVSEGHPDKMADQISDAILDALLAKDPASRVACETLISTGFVMIAGEITTNCYVDMPAIAREVIKDIGYDSSEKGYDYHTSAVLTSIDRQSDDIRMGVDRVSGEEQGAGDQGIMFGYAVNETKELMPLSISLSHQLVKTLAEMRKSGQVDFLRPDSKSQVTVEYRDSQIQRIDSIVLSTQHSPHVSQEQVKAFVVEELIPKVVSREWMDANTKIFVNPTGRFVVGGPQGDCGLTGRKIIVDTYGGHGAHGGGAFSGKDPSKVDRSAAYAARHIAKNVVAAGLAEKCLVQLSYAIGVPEPISIMVNHFGTGSTDPEILAKAVKHVWALKPADIISYFDLLKPKFRQTSTYGHFGREEVGFTWEQTEKADELKDAVSTLS